MRLLSIVLEKSNPLRETLFRSGTRCIAFQLPTIAANFLFQSTLFPLGSKVLPDGIFMIEKQNPS